jgi:hypothetical protein
MRGFHQENKYVNNSNARVWYFHNYGLFCKKKNMTAQCIFDNNSILLLLFLIALWYLFKLFLFQTSELTCAKQNLKRCYN